MDNNAQQPAQQPAPQQQPNPTPEPPTPPVASEDDEWTGATADYLLDKGVASDKPTETKKEEPKSDEQAKPKEGEEEKPTPQGDPNDKKSDEESKSSDDSKKETPNTEEQPNQYTPPSRAEIEADRKETIEDIKKQMFADTPTRLEDADGDPIETLEDVQKLINPNTGKNFTLEEAGAWLLAAQKHLNKTIAENNEKAEAIAEVNLTLKEELAAVSSEYADLLNANPNGIRQKVWASWQKTLKKDPDTGIIIETPVSLKEHYDTMLAPYVAMADRMAADEENAAKNQKTEQQQKVAQTKQNARSDRQDVIGGGKIATKDPEEAEWEAAAKAHYEG